MGAHLSARFVDFCVCTNDHGSLAETDGGVECTTCKAAYDVESDVLVLLPRYEDETRQRYLSNYDRIASADLQQPLEGRREIRHDALVRFIGDVRGKRVLDVGSSDAQYLEVIDADVKVALDLALPFLQAAGDGLLKVCADAEILPVKPGYFDVIIVSDVLEHVLDPEQVVRRLVAVSSPDTRIIVHVPWQEDLAPYAKSEFEFTHLRTFDAQSIAVLFRDFYLARERPSYPSLEQPLVYRIRRFMPRFVYALVLFRYFHGRLSYQEERLRNRWIEELPKHDRWLLYLYPGKFRMFEFRPLRGSWVEQVWSAFRRLKFVGREWRGPVKR